MDYYQPGKIIWALETKDFMGFPLVDMVDFPLGWSQSPAPLEFELILHNPSPHLKSHCEAIWCDSTFPCKKRHCCQAWHSKGLEKLEHRLGLSQSGVKFFTTQLVNDHWVLKSLFYIRKTERERGWQSNKAWLRWNLEKNQGSWTILLCYSSIPALSLKGIPIRV